MIDRDAARQELAGLDGANELLDDLEVLVDAGLVDEQQSVSGTRYVPRPWSAQDGS